MTDSKPPLGLLAALVLIMGLYVSSVVMGWGPAGGLASCSPSTKRRADLHANGWLRPAPVDRMDLHLGGCSREGDRLLFPVACGIEIAAKGRWGSRGLRLLAELPLDVDFQPRGKDAVRLKPHLEAGKSADLIIPSEGATLALRCTAPARALCSVRLE